MKGDSTAINAIDSAIGWVVATLLGSVATAVAVIAVASVGFLMLTGRIDIRRGARVVLGCFILFGASAIAAGIHLGALGVMRDTASKASDAQPYYEPPPPPAYPEAAPQPYDPYAGAAVAPRP